MFSLYKIIRSYINGGILDFGFSVDAPVANWPRLHHIRLSAERLTTWHVEKVHCLQNLPTGLILFSLGLRETLAIFFLLFGK